MKTDSSRIDAVSAAAGRAGTAQRCKEETRTFSLAPGIGARALRPNMALPSATSTVCSKTCECCGKGPLVPLAPTQIRSSKCNMEQQKKFIGVRGAGQLGILRSVGWFGWRLSRPPKFPGRETNSRRRRPCAHTYLMPTRDIDKLIVEKCRCSTCRADIRVLQLAMYCCIAYRPC